MQNLTLDTVSNTKTVEHPVHIENVEQHSIIKTILLHIIPGALIYALFLLTAPLFESWGYPGIMGLIFGSGVVLPLTLVELYRMGQKHNGKLSLQSVVLYRQKLPWWQYGLWTALAVAYAFVVTILITPLFQPQILQFFTWWPGYTARLSLGNYPASHILVTVILYIALNALFPIIEELYFRGYLMARISRFGTWTPFISMLLFSLYHLWQPWNNVLNLLTLWPLTFVSWKTRNVYLGISIHCTLNILGMLPLIIMLIK